MRTCATPLRSTWGLSPVSNETGPWLQVGTFKRQLKAYQAKSKHTQAEVARELGTTYGTLRFWLSGKRPPKRANLQAAAALFNCSVLEFMDDPGSSLAGLGDEGSFGSSEEERVILRAMAKDLRQLSSEDQRLAFEVWSTLARGMKKRDS